MQAPKAPLANKAKHPHRLKQTIYCDQDMSKSAFDNFSIH